MNLGQQLSFLIANTPIINDPRTIECAINGVVDYFASSLQARHEVDIHRLLNWIDDEGGKAKAWLLGQKKLATARQAALFNGFQAHCLDYDDVHSDIRGHPSAVILSALFASIQLDEIQSPIDGKRFLTAYVIGIEVMARLGKSVNPKHYEKGWHATLTLGGIAATAAICYLYNEPFLRQALTLSATQASGIRLVMGTPIKFLHAGLAAQHAIQSVQWLRSGITAEKDFLDEKLGFLAVYGQGNDNFDLSQWGIVWRIEHPGLWFKTYCFCSAAAYIADAGQLLYQHLQFNVHHISHITLFFSPVNSDAALIYNNPVIAEQGRFSAEYILALTLLGIPLNFEQFRSNPIPGQIRILMQKMQRSYQINLAPHADAYNGRYVVIEIELDTGEKISQRIDVPKGSPRNPYSQMEMLLKLTDAIKDQQKAKSLLADIKNLASGLTINQFIAQYVLTL
ncbi:MmgE/PrpD family protein [Gilliamella sp. B2776]|uniref:MmgE/PrpD family protein n=1 Tax=unclassified Gilliamella TaxID=2685620 RepID=UPI00226AFB6D|nr:MULTISPECIES: MmgE/PrpD family protein [unclassified Gilliamella]MCX8650405.1 MmgE/PrpD family protein [Gilliamella sp. B2779]MCX8654622.1 MmgE/PrpD family protein [Gilliamella sp. B2737]MCX8656663.1 MmgE/PrpD family protein [Gilliamella sp. B2894]MCX8665259.1 MmgE/PrpD family protein [Gilliamella sp. B2887]MCX8692178.1 MmgE/PrpD family protein [Gilliamella sp. B2776]